MDQIREKVPSLKLCLILNKLGWNQPTLNKFISVTKKYDTVHPMGIDKAFKNEGLPAPDTDELLNVIPQYLMGGCLTLVPNDGEWRVWYCNDLINYQSEAFDSVKIAESLSLMLIYLCKQKLFNLILNEK